MIGWEGWKEDINEGEIVNMMEKMEVKIKTKEQELNKEMELNIYY